MAALRPRALALALLLLAPASAFAEDPWGQPLPRDGKCSVLPDEAWSPQEKFVWENVCAGRDANFNKAEGRTLDPRKPEEWPTSRNLTSAFLETILLEEKYRRVLTRHGVRIIGARFTERIDLENAKLAHELWLDQSLLEKGADFSGLRSNEAISLESSKIGAPFNMAAAQLGSTLQLRGSEFADLDLTNAHIAGTIDLRSKARVVGRLNMSALHVAKSLHMRGSEFAEVVLADAYVGGTLDLSSAKRADGQIIDKTKINGVLDMNTLRVERSLFMSRGSEFADIDLGSARIGGTLELSDGTKVTGPIYMDKLQVGSSLFMRDGSEFTDVNLTGARVGGTFDLSNKAKVSGLLSMSSAQIASHLFMRHGSEFKELRMIGARIGGTLALNHGTKVTGTIDMDKLQVASSLFMGDGSVFADIDLGSAQIGGQLDLGDGTKVTGWLRMGNLRVAANIYMRNGSEFREVSLVGSRVGGALEVIKAKIAGQFTMEPGSRLRSRLARIRAERRDFRGRPRRPHAGHAQRQSPRHGQDG
jgi:hypothetical protein